MNFDLRTVTTVYGYGLTKLRKLINYRLGRRDLRSVFNYLQINPLLATSGQPNPHQLRAIADAGYKTVINLAPHHVENSLHNEAELVADLGMQYINIPVAFNNPTQQDWQQFVDCMTAHQGQKIWVHCAANMRVSCFVFRYRTLRLKQDPSDAQKDLRKIWKPSGVWDAFITTGISTKSNPS